MLSANKPHPQSYGADLPLRPLSFYQLTRLTAEEKRGGVSAVSRKRQTREKRAKSPIHAGKAHDASACASLPLLARSTANIDKLTPEEAKLLQARPIMLRQRPLADPRGKDFVAHEIREYLQSLAPKYGIVVIEVPA